MRSLLAGLVAEATDSAMSRRLGLDCTRLYSTILDYTRLCYLSTPPTFPPSYLQPGAHDKPSVTLLSTRSPTKNSGGSSEKKQPPPPSTAVI